MPTVAPSSRQSHPKKQTNPPIPAGPTGRRMGWHGWVTLLLAVVILVPSCVGFGTKLLEFIFTFRTDPDGAFAITPILNYLLSSAGFMLLLVWATWNGMFRDVEAPKFDLLRREAELDAPARQAPGRLSGWKEPQLFRS